jgi:hypothetical protein
MAQARTDLTDVEMEEMIRRAMLRVLRPRVILVVAIYAMALALTGVGLWKAAAFCAMVWVLIAMPLGRRYVEMVGGVWLFAGMVTWLDIPAINRVIEFISSKLASLI